MQRILCDVDVCRTTTQENMVTIGGLSYLPFRDQRNMYTLVVRRQLKSQGDRESIFKGGIHLTTLISCKSAHYSELDTPVMQVILCT